MSHFIWDSIHKAAGGRYKKTACGNRAGGVWHVPHNCFESKVMGWRFCFFDGLAACQWRSNMLFTTLHSGTECVRIYGKERLM